MYYVEITDMFEALEGRVQFGPFPTRKEATWRGEAELQAADELFTDGRANLTMKVIQAKA